MANDYATITDADTYLAAHDDWLDLESNYKQRLLDIAATLINDAATWDTDDGTHPKDTEGAPVVELTNAVCELAYSGTADIDVLLNPGG